VGDAAAGAGKAHGGKADRRLAGARFANEAQHFAAPQAEIDALDDLMPDIIALALDLETLDLEKGFAFAALGLTLHSRNPLVLCRNQSSTKLTATVRSAMAPAGS